MDAIYLHCICLSIFLQKVKKLDLTKQLLCKKKQGHYDEVHCIATHPIKNNHFFTAAYDGIVCLYDASLHKALWKYVVKGINATCMGVGQNGEIIVLGAKDGK